MPEDRRPRPEGAGPEERMRIGDIARAAGVSVQQVRNYVDLGVLPPVGRTPSNYRIFTRRHAEALLTARELIRGHGWQRAYGIMQAVHGGDAAAALALVDAGHAELDAERADIARVLGMFEDLAADPEGAGRLRVPRGGARIGDVAGAVGMRTSALRVWEEKGLLRPGRDPATGHRVFDAAELRIAHAVALLRRGGYPLPLVAAAVAEMRSTGGAERARARLAEREEELHRRSLLRLRASAAFHAYLRDHAGVPLPD
ncbi:MerR family transcriptional regulator [Nocardiopsis potens]|uniref:MerR family transcriptional regulator n=1 Tax=Nocardiopsis potens TaxID=1246458 RepID=UPI000346BDD7|nr:MerR family transcriptional regulator [Nocardiopsis potens]